MISVIVLTKNEENNIEECLKGLSWCDEKIIIDDCSTDKTIQIAENSGAKIYVNKLKTFADQRNFGLGKAKGEWILFIDADERISPALWFEINQRMNDPFVKNNGYYFKRKDIIWGKQLNFGESGAIKLLRLAKRNSGKWHGDVHEKWNVAGEKETLNNPLFHYPHQSVEEFLREINYYTDLRAAELFNKKVKSNWIDIILYPKAKFIQNYFFKLGILDSLPGLVYAIMMSFHSFLVRGKLWLLWEKRNQIKYN